MNFEEGEGAWAARLSLQALFNGLNRHLPDTPHRLYIIKRGNKSSKASLKNVEMVGC